MLFLKLHKQHLHQFFFGTGGTGLGKQQMEIVGLSVRQQGEPFREPIVGTVVFARSSIGSCFGCSGIGIGGSFQRKKPFGQGGISGLHHRGKQAVVGLNQRGSLLRCKKSLLL